MGYLSCRADSSIATCRSLSAVAKSATSSSPDSCRHSKTKKHATRDGEAAGTANRSSGAARSHHRIHHFTYRQMELATSNFSEEALLGRGSHGSVFKAVLSSGRVVAVKRPSRIRHRHTPVRLVTGGGGGSTTSTTTTATSTSSGHFFGRNEVENEIDVLSQIHGPRLVNLIGFTNDSEDKGGGVAVSASAVGSSSFRKERLLVMEYMPNGTLYDLLHSNPHPPGWARRLRLSLQIARAIHSLHSHDPPILHRDVKSANILLDNGLNARLGDFGLAVCCSKDVDNNGGGFFFSPSIRSTPPAGTLGYLDPGYITPENLSTKTDVFSFGILLLEIVSGRKAIDVAHSPPSIVEWAVPLMRKGKVLALYDPRIAPPRDPVARRQLAALAASCVRSCRDRRPSTEEVVDRLKVLSKTIPSKAWNGLTVGNPCSVVETERTHSKLPPTNLECNPTSSPDTRCTSPRKSIDIAEEKPITMTKNPAPVLPIRVLRNARRVFSDASPSGPNLKDLMNVQDEETIGAIGTGAVTSQGSSTSRARALHLNRDCSSKDNVLKMQRNLSLIDGLSVLSMSDKDGDPGRRVRIQEPL